MKDYENPEDLLGPDGIFKELKKRLIEKALSTLAKQVHNGVGIFLGENDISITTLADHIDYVAQLIGPEHVGFGLDYPFDLDGLDRVLAARKDIWPEHLGYRSGMKFMAPEALPELTDELLRRKWSDDHIRGFLG